jgi:hypothetical protein
MSLAVFNTSNNFPDVKLYKAAITVLAMLIFQSEIFIYHGSGGDRVVFKTIQAFQFLTKRDRTKITSQRIQSVHNNFFHATAHPDWIAIKAF